MKALESARLYFGGILRRSYFWLFALLFDPLEWWTSIVHPAIPDGTLLKRLPDQWFVPPEVGLGVFIALVVITSFMTFHDLHRKTEIALREPTAVAAVLQRRVHAFGGRFLKAAQVGEAGLLWHYISSGFALLKVVALEPPTPFDGKVDLSSQQARLDIAKEAGERMTASLCGGLKPAASLSVWNVLERGSDLDAVVEMAEATKVIAPEHLEDGIVLWRRTVERHLDFSITIPRSTAWAVRRHLVKIVRRARKKTGNPEGDARDVSRLAIELLGGTIRRARRRHVKTRDYSR